MVTLVSAHDSQVFADLVDRTRNRSIGWVRGFIEGTNAALKRWHGNGRALCRSIERVMNQMTMGILAHSLTRAATLRRGNCA